MGRLPDDDPCQAALSRLADGMPRGRLHGDAAGGPVRLQNEGRRGFLVDAEVRSRVLTPEESHAQYFGMRSTPWESMPWRLAQTRTSA